MVSRCTPPHEYSFVTLLPYRRFLALTPRFRLRFLHPRRRHVPPRLEEVLRVVREQRRRQLQPPSSRAQPATPLAPQQPAAKGPLVRRPLAQEPPAALLDLQGDRPQVAHVPLRVGQGCAPPPPPRPFFFSETLSTLTRHPSPPYSRPSFVADRLRRRQYRPPDGRLLKSAMQFNRAYGAPLDLYNRMHTYTPAGSYEFSARALLTCSVACAYFAAAERRDGVRFGGAEKAGAREGGTYTTRETSFFYLVQWREWDMRLWDSGDGG